MLNLSLQGFSLFNDEMLLPFVISGIYHQVSEDTHWAPFLKASIHYIRKNYPLPWEEATEKLVAFLFGIASHMVADVSWHSLGIEQGFLQAMAAIDFHGSYSEAHAAGDFGNFCIYGFSNVVYVPVQDLLSIYEKFYGRVMITEDAIVECTYLQLLELYGEVAAVAKLYPFYARKSPFLVDKFQDYFLGGVDDMAFSSNNIFQLTSHMLTSGTRGLLEITGQLSSKHITKPSASYFLKTAYAKLGWAMTSADLNQDGYDDLIAGAPGYSQPGHIQRGSVYIIYGNESGLPHADLDLDEQADEILEGITPSGRFGSALTVLDFNEDGVLDLVVGAPSVGSQRLTYAGSVYIFFGKRERRHLHSLPNITIMCNELYCNLGSSLLAADVDGDGKNDLLVGSPYAPGGGKQRGCVASFYSSFNRSDEGTLLLSDADWIVRGERDYSWFGSSLASIQVQNKTMLLIGSPSWKSCKSLGCYLSQDTKQAVGRVYGYFPPSTQSWFTLSGDEDMGKFGSSLATGFLLVEGIPRQVFVVGAPTQGSTSRVVFISSVLHQAGAALMYGLTERGEPYVLSTFNGDRRFSRFGGDVHLHDLNNDGLDEIIMTSPLRSKDVVPVFDDQEAARVYIYSGNQTTSGNVTNHCSSWSSPCPEDWVRKWVWFLPFVIPKIITNRPNNMLLLVTKLCPTIAPPWTTFLQAFLSSTIPRSPLKLIPTASVTPSSHFILCCPLLLLPSIVPNIRLFSSESFLLIQWPKYLRFIFTIWPSKEQSGLISSRTDRFDRLAVQGTRRSLLQHHNSKASILQCSAFLMVQLSQPYIATGKTIALTIHTFVGRAMS
uniref:Phosphatidylinositol-glycan-specific phospholipase D n=1 Tax=Varanus komodoensis TaxID=61221 RepID=A0A8D2JGN8_VARKO